MGEGHEDDPTSTALGDWFANRFNFGAQRFIMCTSEHSLLTLLVPARDLRKLPDRLSLALGAVLADMEAPHRPREIELAAMQRYQIARTNSRSVLGSMNDMSGLAEAELAARDGRLDLHEVNLRLAEVPCGPLGYRTPGETAWELLCSVPAQ
jgi:hypothetical protein